MTFNHAHIACHRFGLGAKPNELAMVQSLGTKQFLLAQINHYEKNPEIIAKLPSGLSLFKQYNAEAKKHVTLIMMLSVEIIEKFAVNWLKKYMPRVLWQDINKPQSVTKVLMNDWCIFGKTILRYRSKNVN